MSPKRRSLAASALNAWALKMALELPMLTSQSTPTNTPHHFKLREQMPVVVVVSWLGRPGQLRVERSTHWLAWAALNPGGRAVGPIFPGRLEAALAYPGW